MEGNRSPEVLRTCNLAVVKYDSWEGERLKSRHKPTCSWRGRSSSVIFGGSRKRGNLIVFNIELQHRECVYKWLHRHRPLSSQILPPKRLIVSLSNDRTTSLAHGGLSRQIVSIFRVHFVIGKWYKINKINFRAKDFTYIFVNN